MIEKVYVDTNILLDLLAAREPFYSASAALFTLVEERKLRAYVSPLSFTNLFYILRKTSSSKQAFAILRKIRLIIALLPVNQQILDAALSSDFVNFEDAVHYYTAIRKGIPFLITRNIKDYRSPLITVCTAEEYLKIRAASRDPFRRLKPPFSNAG